MTIKEFSEKYGVPYHLAYEATYRVRPVETLRRDREYPEEELFRESDRILLERISKYTTITEHYTDMMIVMHDKRREAGAPS